MRSNLLRCVKGALYVSVGLLIVFIAFRSLNTHFLKGATWWDVMYVKDLPDGGCVLRAESPTVVGPASGFRSIRIEGTYVVVSSDSGRIRISARCGSGPNSQVYETEWHTRPILGGWAHVGRLRIQSNLREMKIADDLESNSAIDKLEFRMPDEFARCSTRVRIDGYLSPGLWGMTTWGLDFTVLKLLLERQDQSARVENLRMDNRSLKGEEVKQHADRYPEYDAYCEVRLWVVTDKEPAFQSRVIPAQPMTLEQMKETLTNEALKMDLSQ